MSLSDDSQENKNIEVTIQLADQLFKLVRDPKFGGKLDADARHNALIEKYKTFADHYPVVLRFLARDIKYNRKAFRKMLERIRDDHHKPKSPPLARTDPQKSRDSQQMKGMVQFIEHQANYAKFLYIEESRVNGKHVNPKKANEIWRIEYDSMMKSLKDITQKEKDARNKYEEEKKTNLEKKRQELLDFILSKKKESSAKPKDAEKQEKHANPAEHASPADSPEEKNELNSMMTELNNFYEEMQKPGFARQIYDEEFSGYFASLDRCAELLNNLPGNSEFDDESVSRQTQKIEFCASEIKAEIARREKEFRDSWLPEHLRGQNSKKKPRKSKGRRKN
jgi:hypothetical protein